MALYPLRFRVRIAPGADLTAHPSTYTWIDVTEHAREFARITRGRTSGASQAGPARCTVRLDTAGGRFVTRQPSGPWFPNLRRNTPLWLEVLVAGVWVTRFTGFVPEWPITWAEGEMVVWVDVVAYGVTYRLGQGQPAPRSAMVWQTLSEGAALDAYWTLEDGADTTEALSALPGGAPMRGGGHFAGIDGPPGSKNLFNLDTRGGLVGDVTSTVTGEWRAECIARMPLVESPSLPSPVLTVYTSGAINRWEVYVGSSAAPTWSFSYWIASTNTAVVGTINGFDGEWHHLRLTTDQNGANIDAVLYVDDVVSASVTVNTQTLGIVQKVATGQGRLPADDQLLGAVGHIAVYNAIASPVSKVTAMRGFAGETAVERIDRVAGLAEIPFVVSDPAASSVRMGPQPLAGIVEAFRDAETVDGGILYESLDGVIAFMASGERYNRDVDLALKYTDLEAPFRPVDGRVINDVTATRPGGASKRVIDDYSAGTEGTYDQPITPNVFEDNQVEDQASWLVHSRTVNELQYPVIKLGRLDDAMAPRWVACDIGSRITVSDPAVELPQDLIDQHLVGYEETLSAEDWRVTMYCEPASPWTIGVLEDPVLGRLDTAGSELTAGVSAGATSMTVLTTLGPRWGTTTEIGFSFDVRVREAGAVVTVSDIAALARDAFGRTVANGWGTADVGGAWTLAGGVAADYSVASNEGRHSMGVVNSVRSMLLPGGLTAADLDAVYDSSVSALALGAAIQTGIYVRYQDSSNFYLLRCEYDIDSGGGRTVTAKITKSVLGAMSTVSQTVVPGLQYAAAQRFRTRVQVAGNMFRIRIWPAALPEPAEWSLEATDGSISAAGRVGLRSLLTAGNTNVLPVTIAYDTLLVASQPQTFTISAAPRAFPVGADVRLANPIVLGL